MPYPYDEIRRLGAVKAVVSFSGGNDEGYCDSVKLISRDGSTVAQLEEHYGGQSYVNGRWVSDPIPDEKMLAHALCQPVYDRYGSFAGEFYVSGIVTWDAETSTCRLSEDYQEYASTHHEYDL